MKKVQYKNRYGITLAGDLYLPEGYEGKKNPKLEQFFKENLK